MAELVTIDGQQYKKREPLGVLGLSVITLGIYWLYWYYTINDEIRRFERLGASQTLSPAINVVLLLLVHIAVGLYSQEHLNKVWDAATGRGMATPPPPMPAPPA